MKSRIFLNFVKGFVFIQYKHCVLTIFRQIWTELQDKKKCKCQNVKRHRNIWNFKLSEQRMHKMPLTKLARRYYCLQRRPKEQGRVYSARLKRFYFDDMKWYVCKSKISKISSNHGVFIMKRYKSFTASPSVIWRYFQNFHLECFKPYWIHSHYLTSCFVMQREIF